MGVGEEQTMNKMLITGVSGFVGYYFLEYLCNKESDISVWGLDCNEPRFKTSKYVDCWQFDLWSLVFPLPFLNLT